MRALLSPNARASVGPRLRVLHPRKRLVPRRVHWACFVTLALLGMRLVPWTLAMQAAARRPGLATPSPGAAPHPERAV